MNGEVWLFLAIYFAVLIIVVTAVLAIAVWHPHQK